MSKTITNSKMADASSDILFDSVRFVLSNWTVIQLAVEHGFGGRDTAEKAEWMVNVINQVLRENETIENYELEDYIEEILFNEFHTVAEDESLPKVVQKLCAFQRLWKEGNTKQIQQEISSAPRQKLTPCVKSKAVTSDSDSDDDDDNNEAGARALCNGHHEDDRTNNSSVSQQLDDLHISDKNTQPEPDCSQTETRGNERSSIQSQTQDQDEEGWEVVRRSKKR
ncbi:pre-rRNA-processing protein TSR2 homolog [Orbicella faveolata]|uniref:pre-rRNA-processing protein TSR2 homolog n=1 Tax=Orbicella faveolata TaxID=48498 RepID=UPI0009E525F6|nr:pre-rRNA-processing protein TSR2 homolog [Orbicella faveolata]